MAFALQTAAQQIAIGFVVVCDQDFSPLWDGNRRSVVGSCERRSFDALFQPVSQTRSSGFFCPASSFSRLMPPEIAARSASVSLWLRLRSPAIVVSLRDISAAWIPRASPECFLPGFFRTRGFTE